MSQNCRFEELVNSVWLVGLNWGLDGLFGVGGGHVSIASKKVGTSDFVRYSFKTKTVMENRPL